MIDVRHTATAPAGYYLYGIYLPNDRWTIIRNRRKAEKFAREHGGYVIRVHVFSDQYDREPWDSITFAKVGELIADYRIEKPPAAY